EQLAAAYATRLSSSGLASLSHPLYARLYRQDAVSRSSPAADGSFLQEILELCPLQTPAATLVESKLSNRALRLDSLRQKSSEQAVGSASERRSRKRREGLKLSRTQAKRLGLFDVSQETGWGLSATVQRQRRGQRAPPGEHLLAFMSQGDKQGDRSLTGEDKAPNADLPRTGESQQTENSEQRDKTKDPPEADGQMEDAESPFASVTSSPRSPRALASSAPSAERTSPFEALLASSFSGLRYEHLEGLHALWLEYISAVCGAREASAPQGAEAVRRESREGGASSSSFSSALSKKGRKEERKTRDAASWQKAFDRCTVMSKADFHGAKVKVVRSKTPALVGRQGIVVEETQQSLLLLGEDQVLRRVMKAGAVLSVESLDGSTFFLHAQHLQHSSVGRSKTKLKPKLSLALE
ncbi:putative POP4 domain protein, partial [Toxoplasma gondii MAS]